MGKGSLYSKIFVWLLLHLLLLGAVGIGFVVYVLFGSADGQLPSNVFSSNIENTYRVISVNLQYRPTEEWDSILAAYDEPGLTFHLASMDDLGYLYTTRGFIPSRVLNSVAQMPRTLFTLCPDPSKVFSAEDYNALESGLAPTPPAIFMYTGKPAHFWYGRVLFVPDDKHQPHYLLLATESTSFNGNGLFFEFSTIIAIALLVVAISCLWWAPFIWRLTRPISQMADFAEEVTFSPQNSERLIHSQALHSPAKRRDEIGRLAQALLTMAERLTKQMLGQQHFIRHIAHELNSPLARCKLRLEILEDNLDGENQDNVRETRRELDNLSDLTDDVLAFMRSQSAPEPAKLERLELEPLLSTLILGKPWAGRIELHIPPGTWVWGDKYYLRQAVSNVLANSLAYGGDGPIVLEAMETPGLRRGLTEVVLNIKDHGPGVSEQDLQSLDEPFFRGGTAKQKHPGGSGLGLAIAGNSLEECRGSLSFANHSGGGFIVSMRFSCARPGTD